MKNNGATSFHKIKADVLQRIRNREFLPGDAIPNEEDIARDYGCSRSTVNRALRELADAGVVERRRKAGTRVTVQPPRSARLEIPVVRKVIEQKGAAYRYALLERHIIKAPPEVMGKLSLTNSSDVLRIRCLHYADETPYQLEERWINLVAVPGAHGEPFRDISPNEWLVDNEPLTDAEHIFSASNATAEQAKLLDLKLNDALFVVERRTWSNRHTITAVKLFHPGASFKMVSRS